MAGAQQYSNVEILFILTAILHGLSVSWIVTMFQRRFGRALTDNQVQYIKNKYGRDPRFGTPMANVPNFGAASSLTGAWPLNDGILNIDYAAFEADGPGVPEPDLRVTVARLAPPAASSQPQQAGPSTSTDGTPASQTGPGSSSLQSESHSPEASTLRPRSPAAGDKRSRDADSDGDADADGQTKSSDAPAGKHRRLNVAAPAYMTNHLNQQSYTIPNQNTASFHVADPQFSTSPYYNLPQYTETGGQGQSSQILPYSDITSVVGEGPNWPTQVHNNPYVTYIPDVHQEFSNAGWINYDLGLEHHSPYNFQVGQTMSHMQTLNSSHSLNYQKSIQQVMAEQAATRDYTTPIAPMAGYLTTPEIREPTHHPRLNHPTHQSDGIKTMTPSMDDHPANVTVDDFGKQVEIEFQDPNRFNLTQTPQVDPQLIAQFEAEMEAANHLIGTTHNDRSWTFDSTSDSFSAPMHGVAIVAGAAPAFDEIAKEEGGEDAEEDAADDDVESDDAESDDAESEDVESDDVESEDVEYEDVEEDDVEEDDVEEDDVEEDDVEGDARRR
ncbi:hypothetical protein QQS21_009924 [Conoideocrella luteorostrata]|uniref:Uncharacterized protein n=1 Tax=Conoideocrella luteorostrata TaxID=1105319 RepID=A0AAJ0CG04_9HYPO|nr:hypothetical protein QQS21_009924 [Conoideocrella luteorostrata]